MENQPISTKKPNQTMLIVVIIIILIGAGVAIYFATQKEDDINTTSNTNMENLYTDLMQYDDKVIEITSSDGKVVGQLAISIDKTQIRPITVVYFLKVDDALPKSIDAASGAGEAYYYIANHTTAETINEGDGTGALSEAFCNTSEMPDVLGMAQQRSIDLELYRGCDAQNDPFHTTETFYHLYANYYNNYDFDYESLISKDTLAIFDSAPYYVADEETGGWGADDSAVISQAEPTTTYSLIYSLKKYK